MHLTKDSRSLRGTSSGGLTPTIAIFRVVLSASPGSSRNIRRPISCTVTIASSTRTAKYNASVGRSNSAASCCSTIECCISQPPRLFFAGESLTGGISWTNSCTSRSTPNSSCGWHEVDFASVISVPCWPTFGFNRTARRAARRKSNSKRSAGSWRIIRRCCKHSLGQWRDGASAGLLSSSAAALRYSEKLFRGCYLEERWPMFQRLGS